VTFFCPAAFAPSPDMYTMYTPICETDRALDGVTWPRPRELRNAFAASDREPARRAGSDIVSWKRDRVDARVVLTQHDRSGLGDSHLGSHQADVDLCRL
jgi:hypothetical protein